jgi:hypothetical protein
MAAPPGHNSLAQQPGRGEEGRDRAHGRAHGRARGRARGCGRADAGGRGRGGRGRGGWGRAQQVAAQLCREVVVVVVDPLRDGQAGGCWAAWAVGRTT